MTFPLAPNRATEVGRLIAITDRVLGRERVSPSDVQIVFTRPAEPPRVLRRKLLAVSGIGPETADAIALYAAGQPLFVVDAYTRRVFGRLGMLRGGETYDEVQALFMEALPADVSLYRDFHAQIVRLAKDVCRKTPRCGGCALEEVCVRGGLE